jgi:hypothetical protein
MPPSRTTSKPSLRSLALKVSRFQGFKVSRFQGFKVSFSSGIAPDHHSNNVRLGYFGTRYGMQHQKKRVHWAASRTRERVVRAALRGHHDSSNCQ